MNEIDEQAGDSPLIEEPEETIGTLSEILHYKIEPVKIVKDLTLLAKKSVPYTMGIVAALYGGFKENVIDTLRNTVEITGNKLKQVRTKAKKEHGDLLKESFGYSDMSIDILNTIDNINGFIGDVMYFIYFGLGTIGMATAELLNLKNKVVQKMNQENPVNLPDVNAILGAYIKQGLEEDETRVLLRQHGYSTYKANVFLDSIKRIPDIEILFQNLWRDKITSDDMNKYLAKLAFDEDEQILITNLAERIPPIQDIIRFSVREAFHDVLSEKYGHDAEFPEDVANWSKKQGFSEDWAKKYWRAHWQLPSVQMAFEMMHRSVKKDDGTTFTQDDITELLKMQDYPVAWRNLLTQISYRVITRVDARRMYDLGVWDNLIDMTAKEKLLQVYMSQGYNKEDAGYMVDFTEQYHMDRRRGFTKAGLKKIYKYGIITETTFREKLTDMRIREEEIEFLIDEANYEIEDKRLDSFMSKAKAMYQTNQWTQEDTEIEMSNMNLHLSNPDNLFESWDYDKQGNRRVLSKADIQRLLKKGLIETRKDAIQRFELLGYDTQSAEWLTDETTFEEQEI